MRLFGDDWRDEARDILIVAAGALLTIVVFYLLRGPISKLKGALK